MTNVDELAEMHYASKDPQFRDEEAETRRTEKDTYLDRLRKAYDAVDDANQYLASARYWSDSPTARELLGKYIAQLDTLSTQLEKLL